MHNDDLYFSYPDGTNTLVRPTDGQICRVPSHKRGKTTDWEWDDEAEMWALIPNSRTPLEVIEKTKEILKIGKFSNLRPEKPRPAYWRETWDSEYPYLTGENDGWPHNVSYDERDPVTCFQASGTPSGLMRKKDPIKDHPVNRLFSSDGRYVPCECGAIYTDKMNDHYDFCPRHPDNAWKRR